MLGLRRQDVDFGDGEIRIRQQLQRVRGELRLGPIKTNAGRRDLPLLPQAVSVLSLRRAAQEADRQELGVAWRDNGLVFTTKTGRPIEPRNLVRSFRRICANAKIRAIKVHHLRHTTATVPGRARRMSSARSAMSCGKKATKPTMTRPGRDRDLETQMGVRDGCQPPVNDLERAHFAW
jgi:integrase